LDWSGGCCFVGGNYFLNGGGVGRLDFRLAMSDILIFVVMVAV